MASCEDISGSCDCPYFFWCCKASVVSTESTRRIRNDVANAAVWHGGENESRILAQCPPNPHVYPSHKTTRLSRRRCVLPQPAQATAISGSPFLFLPTVEFLVYDSAYQF